MNRKSAFWALVIALAAVAATPAAADASSAEERNEQWLLALVGLDEVPAGEAVAVTPAGARSMSAADAFGLAAERARGADLAALAAGASDGGPGVAVGDMSAIGTGSGPCPPVELVPVGLPPTTLHPQLWTHGDVGSGHHAGSGLIVDWTTKGTAGGFYASGIDYAGFVDYFCVSFFGLHLMWLDVSGVLAY